MKAELGVGLHNKFDIQVVDATGTIKQSITAYNVVLNNYYNYLQVNNNVHFGRLYLGTGTGTPSVADTGLFTQLTYKDFDFVGRDIVSIQTNQYSVSTTVTFTEVEAIGLISELGIGNRSGAIFTHAMVTDAEGSVISINKTNTDRLIITLTLYLTLTRPPNVVPFKNVAIDCYSVYADTATTDTGYVEQIVAACLGFNTPILGDSSSRITYSLSPGCPGSSVSPAYAGHNAVAMSYDISYINNVLRIQNNNTILSTDANLQGTYQIYGICTPIGYIPITPDIFPTLSFTLSKTADGTQRAFNFGIAELLPNVHVYIDDVLQPANTYTWNGKDYSIFQAWETCQAKYVTKSPTCLEHSAWYSCYATPIFNYMPMFGNEPRWHNKDIVYDFGSSLSFNRAYKPSPSSAYSNWEYSNDGETWNTVEIPATPETSYYDFSVPISARYLRMQNAVTDWSWTGYWVPPFPVLCCYSDQLVFNNPPPLGSVIKVDVQTAYPIKNANWIMDQFVLDLKISRA